MKRTILMISLLSLFIFCGQKQEEVERIMEDGVEVVINHLEPYKVKGEPSNLVLEEELRIDFEDENLAQFGIKDISYFDADSEGNIFGLERYKKTDYMIYKFSKNGEFIKKFGRMGQGPGEIQSVGGMIIGNDNIIRITDRGNLKILEFDNEGHFIRERKTPYSSHSLTPLENGNYLAYRNVGAPPPEKTWELHLFLYNSDFEEIKELDTYLFNRHYKSGKNDGLIANIRWNVVGDRIYIANGQRGYEIWIYDLDGNLLRKIRKEYRPIKYPEEFRKQTEEMIKRRPIFYTVEYCFPFNTFFVDERGMIYVMTYELGKNKDEYIHDIFDSDGVFIGRKSMPISGLLGRSLNPTIPSCKNNRYFRLRYKESGFMELIVYKLILE